LDIGELLMANTKFPVLFRFAVFVLLFLSTGSTSLLPWILGALQRPVETAAAASTGYQIYLPLVVKPASLTTYQYRSNEADILNPERGFRSSINLLNSVDYSQYRNTQKQTLVFSYIRLDDYRASDLPADFLASVDAGFARLRKAGIKVVLRVAYNAGFDPDASKDWMLRHIAQLGPTFQKNADVIAWMQAGFIGAWGEWHTSTNGLNNPTDERDILNALLNTLPKDRIVQVRSIKDLEAIYPNPLTTTQAFTDSLQARTGHHNDCFLASDTDLGTYGSKTLATDKSYLSQIAQFTPIGGETCIVNPPRSECASALQEMALLHYTELNETYNADVIAGWKQGGCYEEIRRRLGYRLTLLSAAFETNLVPGRSLHLDVSLQNKGFAAPVNARAIYAVLDGPARYVFPLTADPRRWQPGNASFSAQIPLPKNLAAGTYHLALWLPDASPALRNDPHYAIHFANENMWEDTTGFNILGSVTIQ
jgi:hypothetical protein